MKKLVLVLLFLVLVTPVLSYPKLTNYVNDFADLLSAEEETKLNEDVDGINIKYLVEIAIVTLQNTEGDGRTNYANRIGEENGVGKKGKDNGIVILWSLDNEKGGAIATGRGIESLINDAKVTRIGRASRKHFDQGEYYQAFGFILNEIKVELDKAQTQGEPLATGSATQNLNFNNILIVIAVLILILFIFVKTSRKINSYSDGYKPTRFKSTGYVPIIIPPIKTSGSSESSSYKSSSSDDDDDDDYSGRSSSYAGSSYSGGGFSGFSGGSFGGGGGAF